MRDHTEIGLVVSSRQKAAGILKARRAGIPVHVLANPINWNDLNNVLRAHNITHIFLLGFMKIIPENFVSVWMGRILNIHPSLLPAYPGLDSIKKSFTDRHA